MKVGVLIIPQLQRAALNKYEVIVHLAVPGTDIAESH